MPRWVVRAEPGAKDAFTPDEALIAAVDAGLPGAARAIPEWKVPLAEYARQYVGKVRDGRRHVLVELIHRDDVAGIVEAIDPTKMRIVVYDGGDRFVSVDYDVDARTYDVYVHGEA